VRHASRSTNLGVLLLELGRRVAFRLVHHYGHQRLTVSPFPFVRVVGPFALIELSASFLLCIQRAILNVPDERNLLVPAVPLQIRKLSVEKHFALD
jgi:hypothetical protein